MKGKYYKLITVQYYTDNCVSWVPGLIGTHLMNALLVQNLFVCSGLTVIKKKNSHHLKDHKCNKRDKDLEGEKKKSISIFKSQPRKGKT